MNREELENRFAYHTPSSEEIKEGHEVIRDHCGQLADLLNNWVPEGREKSLTITKLEEVMFWANAAIARTQTLGGQQS